MALRLVTDAPTSRLRLVQDVDESPNRRGNRSAETSEQAFARREAERAMVPAMASADPMPEDEGATSFNVIPRGVSKLAQSATLVGGLTRDAFAEAEANPEGPMALGVMLRRALGGAPAKETRGILAADEFNRDLQRNTDELFPKPVAQAKTERELGEAVGVWETLKALARNPLGSAQLAGESLASSVPAVRLLRVAGGSGLASGAEATTVGEQFDNEFAQMQALPGFNKIRELVGDDAIAKAAEGEKARRIQQTLLGSTIGGAATAGITSRIGLNPIDEAIAGKTGALSSRVPSTIKEIAGEAFEGGGTQASVNLATGRPLLEQVPESAAMEAALGGVTAAPVDAFNAAGAVPQTVRNIRETIRQASSAADLSVSPMAAAFEQASRQQSRATTARILGDITPAAEQGATVADEAFRAAGVGTVAAADIAEQDALDSALRDQLGSEAEIDSLLTGRIGAGESGGVRDGLDVDRAPDVFRDGDATSRPFTASAIQDAQGRSNNGAETSAPAVEVDAQDGLRRGADSDGDRNDPQRQVRTLPDGTIFLPGNPVEIRQRLAEAGVQWRGQAREMGGVPGVRFGRNSWTDVQGVVGGRVQDRGATVSGGVVQSEGTGGSAPVYATQPTQAEAAVDGSRFNLDSGRPAALPSGGLGRWVGNVEGSSRPVEDGSQPSAPSGIAPVAGQQPAEPPPALRDLTDDASLESRIAAHSQKSSGLSRPMAFVDAALRDPDAAHAALDDLIVENRKIEREILAKYGAKRTSDLDEDALTEDERQFLFYSQDAIDSETASALRQSAPFIGDAGDATFEIAALFRDLPSDGNFTDAQLARGKFVIAQATRLGLDGGALLRNAAQQYGARFSDPNDAADMVAHAARAFGQMVAADGAQIGAGDVPALAGPGVQSAPTNPAAEGVGDENRAIRNDAADRGSGSGAASTERGSSTGAADGRQVGEANPRDQAERREGVSAIQAGSGDRGSTGAVDGGVVESLRTTLSRTLGPKFLRRLESQPWFNLVESLDQLPPDVRKSITGDGIAGFVLDGNVYIVADSVGDNAAGVVLHEVGVHFGMSGLPDFPELLREFKSMRRMPTVKRAYESVPADTDASLIDEEAFAYFVEQNWNVKSPLMTRIKDAIARLLGRFGIPTSGITDALMRQALDGMVQAAREAADATTRGVVTVRDGRIVYTFAGRNAKTANIGTLERAKAMIADGASAEDARKATGWHEGRDGKWRFEIDDSGASASLSGISDWKRAELRGGRSVVVSLGTVLKHDKLFSAYPDIADVGVTISPKAKDGGQYSQASSGEMIVVGADRKALRIDLGTLLHEIQHAIQSREVFSKGSSPSATKNYANISGEVEARNVETRQRMTEAERRDTPPRETQDVSDEQQIVITDEQDAGQLRSLFKSIGASYQAKYSRRADGGSVGTMKFTPEQTAAALDESRWFSRGAKVRPSAKVYRGVSERSGTNAFTYGRGLYTTLSKSDAAEWGRVVEVDRDALPSNPIRFDSIGRWQEWEQFIAYDLLKFRRRSEFEGEMGSPEKWVRALDPTIDGVQIGAGADAFFVKWPPPAETQSDTRQAPPREGLGASGLAAVESAWDAAGISAAISERDGVIKVGKIVVPQDQRGRGIGTDAMRKLTDYADATGQRIVLSPSADFGGDKGRLVEFYKRAGFVENKGRGRDLEISETMYREPKTTDARIAYSRKTPAGARAESAQKRTDLGAQLVVSPGQSFVYTDQFTDDWRGQTRKMRERIQDKLLSVRDAQKDIEQIRGAIEDAANVYRRENLMHGRVGDQRDKLQASHVKPLIEAMAEAKVSPALMEDYLEARHAKERNEKIAATKGGMPDGASGMTTAQAEDFLQGRTAGHRSGVTLDPAMTRQVSRLARKVDAITAETRRRLLDSGQITQATFDAIENAYAAYVPLRGKDGKESGGRGTGKGIDVRGKPLQRAAGRGEGNRAQNILAEIIADAERSIVNAEKLRVGRTLARLVLENPNPDVWAIEPVKTELKVSDGTPEEIYEAIKNLDQEEGTILVKVKGKPYRIVIEDKRMADALKNMAVETVPVAIQYVAALNRYFSAVLTRYNPSFVGVNMTRDMLFGLTGIWAEHGTGAALTAAKSYFPAMRAVWRDIQGKPPVNALGRYAREFAEAGGKTHFGKLENVDDLAQRIGQEFKTFRQMALPKSLGGESSPIRALAKVARDSKMVQAIEAVNDTVENTLRLSVYAARREAGASVEQAAEYAKNISVNFNRRGSATSWLNALYLFFNAATQGAHRTLTLLQNRKVQGALAGLAALQATSAMFLMGLDDEDGEPLWDSISPWDKQRNLIFAVPIKRENGWGATVIKIPMPYGFNLFPYMGGRTVELARDLQEKPVATAIADYTTDAVVGVAQAMSPLPFDDGWEAAVPYWLRIFTALQANRSDLGIPIRAGDQYDAYEKPRSSSGRDDTPRPFKMLSTAMNRVGLGDDYTPPYAKFALDWAPEDLAYLFKTFTGGLGSNVVKTGTLTEKLVAGVPVNFKDVPILSSFVSNVDQRQATSTRYYDNKDAIEREVARQRDLAKATGDVGDNAMGIRVARNKSGGKVKRGEGYELEGKSGSLFDTYKDSEKEIRRIRDEMRATFNDQSIGYNERIRKIDELKSEREEVQRELNAAWRESRAKRTR